MINERRKSREIASVLNIVRSSTSSWVRVIRAQHHQILDVVVGPCRRQRLRQLIVAVGTRRRRRRWWRWRAGRWWCRAWSWRRRAQRWGGTPVRHQFPAVSDSSGTPRRARSVNSSHRPGLQTSRQMIEHTLYNDHDSETVVVLAPITDT